MELITTRLVKASDVGFHGNLFGGKLAAWMDEAGAAFAAQVCDTPRVVTVLMEDGRQSNVCTTRLKFVRINDDGEAVPVKRKKIAKKYNITLDK